MGQTNRAGLFYDNLLEIADTITATSEASVDTPVENLLSFQPGEKWRSASDTDQTITLAFDEAQVFRFIGLFAHNLTASATARVRISDNADLSNPKLDMTLYAWPSLTGLEDLPLDEGGLDGAPDITNYESWQYRTALFLDLIVDFAAKSVNGLNVQMPSQVTRITGGVETASADGEMYIGMPIKAPVQRRSIVFERVNFQYLSMSDAEFGLPDWGRFGCQFSIKRTSLGTQQTITHKNGSLLIEFTTANKLRIALTATGGMTAGELITTATFTDTADYVTIRFEYDKNEPTNRMQVWVAGEAITAFDTETQPDGNIADTANPVYIGRTSAGTNYLNAALYNFAFFTGFMPSADATFCGNGRSCELAALDGVHSLIVPTATAFTDHFLTANWTAANSIASTTSIPTNFNQTRYVSDFDPISRKAIINSAWTVPPEAGDTLRIDMMDAIGDVVNDFTYYGKYLAITISDPDNETGYLEAGYLAIGDYLQPEHGMDVPHVQQYIDPSQKFTSFGGATWVSKRTIWRQQSFSFGYLTEQEAITEIDAISARNGGSKPIIFMPHVENTGRAYQGLAYGLLEQPPSIRQVRQSYRGASFAADFTIQELR